MVAERARMAMVAVVLAFVVTGTVVPGVTLARDDGSPAGSTADLTAMPTGTANVTGTIIGPQGAVSTSDMVYAFTVGDTGSDVGNYVWETGDVVLPDLTAGEEYEITYYQDYRHAIDDDPTTDYMPRDGSPDIYAIDRRTISGETDFGTVQLPSASTVNVTIVNESGAPVEGANVTVIHRNVTNGAEAGLFAKTEADGRYYIGGKAGVEVAENVTVEVAPPDDEKYVDRTYTRNLTVTSDQDLTITLEEQRIAGQLVGPDGRPLSGMSGTIIGYYQDPTVYEEVRTNATGNFFAYVPDGRYFVCFLRLDSSDGMADSWGLVNYTVDGSTDLGTRTVPRGYNLTVNATDGSGRPTDAYVEIRDREETTWVYEYASGTPLDAYWEGNARGWYNVSRREVSNGTYELTAVDSWTKDVIGTKTVTIDGAARSETITVDPYNGTDLAGAVGPSVVRDLPTDADVNYTLQGGYDGDVNVRLFLLNTTAGETVSVRENLPAGYEYVPGSIVGDGAPVSNVTVDGDDLSFDVDGAASAVRYRIRTTDGGRDFMAFRGSYSTEGDANATLGDAVIDSEAPMLAFENADPASLVSPQNPLSITYSTEDDTPSELVLTVENANTGEVVSRREHSVGAGIGFHSATWDATNATGEPVPSGDYVVRVASVADAGPTAEATRTVTVDTTDPTVDLTAIGASTSPTGSAGTTVYTNGTLGVDLTADGTPGDAASVRLFLGSRESNFVARYDATDEGAGTWTVREDLSGLPDDGRYDVSVHTIDPAGNWGSAATAATVVLDREAPELRAIVDRVDAETARVDIVASEDLSNTPRVTVERPDGSTATATMAANGTRRWNGTFSVADDGQYDLTVTGVDRAGNEGTATASANVSTVSTENQTVTVKMEPSGLFVRFNTSAEVENGFVTITGSRTPLAPLVRGNAGVRFLNAKLGDALSENLTNATIGIPVDESSLPAGVAPDDVSIRYYDETTGRWEEQPTTRRTVTLADGTTGEYWLAEVAHFSTYGAVAEDSDAPALSEATPTGDLAEGTTDVTVRFDYADALSGVNASEVTLTFNGFDVTDLQSSSVTGEYATYEATGLSPGAYVATVRVVDEAGNEATFDTPFTVPAPPGSDVDDGTIIENVTVGGGNSGPAPAPAPAGGGGGSAPPPPSILADVAPLADGGATVSYSGARAGETVRTLLDGVAANGVAFTGLDLELAGEHGPFALDLVPAAESGVDPLPSNARALTYLRVDHEVGDSVVGSAQLDFTVKRSALPDGATLNDVAVYRFHDGSWTEIETSRRGNRFTAETPGFSVFAVVAEPGEASFVTNGATLGRESIGVGETIDVSALVENVGSEHGTAEVALVVDGKTVATRAVGLDPGESRTVVFRYEPRTAGDYTVSIDGAPAGTLVVTEQVTATAGAETTGDGETTTTGQSGFGVLAALVALVSLLAAGRRRSNRN